MKKKFYFKEKNVLKNCKQTFLNELNAVNTRFYSANESEILHRIRAFRMHFGTHNQQESLLTAFCRASAIYFICLHNVLVNSGWKRRTLKQQRFI